MHLKYSSQQFSGINIFICNSPTNAGSNKIINFHNMFNHESVIEEISQYFVEFTGYDFKDYITEAIIKIRYYRGTIFISKLNNR